MDGAELTGLSLLWSSPLRLFLAEGLALLDLGGLPVDARGPGVQRPYRSYEEDDETADVSSQAGHGRPAQRRRSD
jgi:hypothetical protein